MKAPERQTSTAVSPQTDEVDMFASLLGMSLNGLREATALLAATVAGTPASGTVQVNIGGLVAPARYLTSCVGMKDKDEVRVLRSGGGLLVIGILAR